MVSLAAVTNYQFPKFAGKVGVEGEEMQSLLEELAGIRIGAGDSARNDPGQLDAVIGDDAIEIRESDHFFAGRDKIGRIPSGVEGVRRDAAGNEDPSAAEMPAVAFRIGERGPDGFLAEFY